MFPIFYSLLGSLRVWFRGKAKIQLEIISLRHQLAVTHRQNPKPKLTAADRCLWVWLSRNFADRRSVLLIVKPDTVIAWHRQGFRWYWT
jgi:putative transposase